MTTLCPNNPLTYNDVLAHDMRLGTTLMQGNV